MEFSCSEFNASQFLSAWLVDIFKGAYHTIIRCGATKARDVVPRIFFRPDPDFALVPLLLSVHCLPLFHWSLRCVPLVPRILSEFTGSSFGEFLVPRGEFHWFTRAVRFHWFLKVSLYAIPCADISRCIQSTAKHSQYFSKRPFSCGCTAALRRRCVFDVCVYVTPV
jgi:hypothetical protein